MAPFFTSTHMITTDATTRAEAFDEFKEQFALFLQSSLRNSYVYGHDVISVYVRKSQRYLPPGQMVKVLDIASIAVDEDHQNHGVGTRVINHIHTSHTLECTMVESILNEQLYDRLITQGWTDVPNTHPRCVVKYKKRPEPNVCCILDNL